MVASLITVYLIITAVIPMLVDMKYLSDPMKDINVDYWSNNLIVYMYSILIIDIVICGTLNFGLWFLILLPLHVSVMLGLLFSRDRFFRFVGKLMS